jgi:hypothetical protein
MLGHTEKKTSVQHPMALVSGAVLSATYPVSSRAASPSPDLVRAGWSVACRLHPALASRWRGVPRARSDKMCAKACSVGRTGGPQHGVAQWSVKKAV